MNEQLDVYRISLGLLTVDTTDDIENTPDQNGSPSPGETPTSEEGLDLLNVLLPSFGAFSVICLVVVTIGLWNRRRVMRQRGSFYCLLYSPPYITPCAVFCLLLLVRSKS